jgi:hypothetical protein
MMLALVGKDQHCQYMEDGVARVQMNAIISIRSNRSMRLFCFR